MDYPLNLSKSDKKGFDLIQKSTTINQRLSHIKGFCRYLFKNNDVLDFNAYSEISEIAEFKDERVQEFVWMTAEQVKLVLKRPHVM